MKRGGRGAGVDNCNEKGDRCTPSSGQLLQGQSFFCVSLVPAGIEDVAATIIVASPIIYSSRLPKTAASYPQTKALVADSLARQRLPPPFSRSTSTPPLHLISITSLSMTSFRWAR